MENIKKMYAGWSRGLLSLSAKFNANWSHGLFLFCALLTAFIVTFIIGFVFYTALPVFQKEGLGFILGTEWNYSENKYGILIYIVNTLVLTIMTMIIACPLSIFTAIFLSEFSPAWLTRMMRPMIELLVGIPSVVYGIFGLFVLEDLFQNNIDPFISNTFGFISIFQDTLPSRGIGLLLSSTVLAIMVLPTVTVLSEEAMRSVPREYREASFALGATKWETIKKVVIPLAKSGILTAIVFGIMRAMGETMAIVMLLGNTSSMPQSILSAGYAMTSKIVNEIGYYIAVDEARSALFGIAAVLFLLEMLFVILIRVFGSKKKWS